MVEERSLSIRETAELIGVCENTLRDWDHNGKLVALRTLGGHRRYSLNDIRDFLKNNPVYLTQKEDTILEQFEEDKKRINKTPLQVLMENSSLYCENCDSKLPVNQMLWLIETAWGLSRFKNLISIQAMQGPASLCFVKQEKIKSIPLAAKMEKLPFTIFLKEDFERLKDVYARALANCLDGGIFKQLAAYSLFDSESFADFILHSKEPLKSVCDYVIAPKETIEHAQKHLDCSDVEFFEHSVVLNPETFKPLIMVGYKKKIEENFCEPIFMPYLLYASYETFGGCSLLLRCAWYNSEVKKQKEKEDAKLCSSLDLKEYSFPMDSKNETSSSNEKT